MNKLFSNFINKEKNQSLSKNISVKKESEKSAPLIIFGFIIAFSSIFLLLFTINNKFG